VGISDIAASDSATATLHNQQRNTDKTEKFNEEDEGGAKMWVLVNQKISTPKTFTRFGSISISRCQDFVTFFTEKTGPSYLSKYAEPVIPYPPKHTNVQPWNSSKH
jgi:hypothetical protein